MKLGRLGWVGLLCVLAALGRVAAGQTLRVTPDHVMADESAAIQASGLSAREHVAIRAELADGAGQRWSSEAEFVADEAGEVDTAAQAPTKGSYRTVSGLGLVWSMRPEDRGAKAYRAPEDYGLQRVMFHLVRGGAAVADAVLVQEFKGPGVREIRVHGAVQGSLFLPRGDGPWPGVLVLGGAEGGAPVEKALWLAEHGYAALALVYIGQDGLPQQLEHIPLEYFGRALSWMQGVPQIARGTLGVMGTARGGELALQLGAVYPAIKAVVAYAPASVRYPSCCGRWVTAAWTLRGEGLDYIRPLSQGKAQARAEEEAAAIQVERTRGDILVISGGQDGVWPSSLMTQEMEERLREADFAHRFERLDYPRAGHGAGSPQIVPAWLGEVADPETGQMRYSGGSAGADTESGMDAAPKVLRFLGEALGGASELASSTETRSTR